MIVRLLSVWALCLLLCLAACAGDDDDNDNDESADDDATPDDDNDTSTDDDATPDDDDDDTPGCDATRPPIVFAHGFLEEGDAFAAQSMRFAANGYCPERIHAFDWNTLVYHADAQTRQLDAFIDEVLAVDNAAQVELIGHSMGGGLGYDYLRDAARAAKVAHYVHVASFDMGAAPASPPMLNLSSQADYIAGTCDIDGAQNVLFDDLDHLELITSAKTFTEMYRFFNDGEPPATTEIVPEENIELSGRTVVIGTNDPAPDYEIAVYRVDPATGERLSAEPDALLHSDANGYWSGFAAAPNAYYEFACADPDGMFPPLHYFREPFARSCDKVYFRVFPAGDSPLGLLLRLFPFRDRYAVCAWLNLTEAVVVGRNSFTVDGIDLVTPALAAADINTIVVGFFDINFNGASDLTVAGGVLAMFPFIRVFDYLIPTDEREPILFTFDGDTLAVPNLKSRSEGLVFAVFD
ncbi:MAG TPA: hypothetical protein PKW95_05570 [bacterium]|nr:hypothetical protein [bacterium]